MNSSLLLFVEFVLLFPCNGRSVIFARAVERSEHRVAIAICRTLESPDLALVLDAILDQLATWRRLDTLVAISRANIFCSDYAASRVVKLMRTRDAIEFCKQFRVGSATWCAAFRALSVHPKEGVMPYVKTIAGKEAVLVRIYCYLLCQRAEWDDLVELARKDSASTFPFPRINDASEITAGHIARSYLETIARKKAIPSSGTSEEQKLGVNR